jgi:hypothetical protein
MATAAEKHSLPVQADSVVNKRPKASPGAPEDHKVTPPPPVELAKALQGLSNVILGLQGQAAQARQQQAKAKEEAEAKAKVAAELIAITADPGTILKLTEESKARQREIALLEMRVQEYKELHAEEQAKLEGHVKDAALLTTAKEQFEDLRKAEEAATAELQKHNKAAAFITERHKCISEILGLAVPNCLQSLIGGAAQQLCLFHPLLAKEIASVDTIAFGMAFLRGPAIVNPDLTPDQTAINATLLEHNYGGATSTAALGRYLQDHMYMTPEDANAQAPLFMQARAAAANSAAKFITAKPPPAPTDEDHAAKEARIKTLMKDRAAAIQRLQACAWVEPGDRVNLTQAHMWRKTFFDLIRRTEDPKLFAYMDIMMALQTDSIYVLSPPGNATPTVLVAQPWCETFSPL